MPPSCVRPRRYSRGYLSYRLEPAGERISMISSVGFLPYPAAWTELISEDGKRLALKDLPTAEKRPAEHNFPVGSIPYGS